MKKRFLKIWNDPVGSKVLANFIWAGLILLGAGVWFVVQKVWFLIPFSDSWHSLFAFVNQDVTIKYKHLLYTSLLVIVLIVNPQILLILLGILRMAFGPPTNKLKVKYSLTNQGERKTDIEGSLVSYNTYKIKPRNNPHAWSIAIFFSDDNTLINARNEKDMNKVLIYKKANESALHLRAFDEHDKPIPSEYQMLFNDYLDQEFDLGFNFDAGTVLTVLRHGKKIYKAPAKPGPAFKIVALDSNHDFEQEIIHNRADIFPKTVFEN